MGGFATTSTQCSEETALMKSCKAYPLHDSIVLVVPDEKDVCQFGYRLVHPLQTKEKHAKKLRGFRKVEHVQYFPLVPVEICGVIGVVVPQPWSTTLRLDSSLLGIQDCLCNAFFWRVLLWADPWTDPPWTHVILVKEKTNHPQFHHFYRLYKQFPNGWFIVVFPTI